MREWTKYKRYTRRGVQNFGAPVGSLVCYSFVSHLSLAKMREYLQANNDIAFVLIHLF